MRFAVKFLLASAVSVGLLFLTFSDIDPHALWNVLRAVELPYVALYLMALLATQVARAGRWQVLVRPSAALDAASAWRMSNVGNMLIMLLPLRLGELSRPYMLRRERGVPLGAGLGAALVERVLDGLLVTLLFFLTTALIEARYPCPPALRAGALVALAVFAAALVAIVATIWAHPWVTRALHATVGRISHPLADKLDALLTTFVEGMRALPNLGAVAAVLAYTLIYWLANALGIVALMHGFGWDLPWLAGFTVVCVLVIGVMIPAGPGLLGTYQAAIVAGLATYHVERNAAAAFSLVGYLGTLVVVVGCGMAHLIGKRWAEVEALVHTEPDGQRG